MSRILLALLMLQAGGAPTGSVTGIVRTANGIPASGVRVYAQQVREAAEANSAVAPLEGLAQTDGSGQYRLELPVGRYYIASGAVSSPTYFPGTTNVALAKAIVVTSGGLVEGIDFGSFVAATNRVPPLTSAPSLGWLSGTVRYPDGSLAANLVVTAFPSSIPLTILLPRAFTLRGARTDPAGRYRIEGLPANIYYIVAGFAETPGFYTASTPQPKTVLLSQGAGIPGLDFAVPSPPARTGTTITGHVVANDGAPAVGATVRIVMQSPAGPVTSLTLPSINEKEDVRVARDGTFTFSDVVPGYYNVQVFLSKANQFDSIVVEESPVTDLRLSLPAVVFSGQILLEDGRAVPDPGIFVAGVLSTVSNPNLTLSTILPVSAGGTFEALPENNEYRTKIGARLPVPQFSAQKRAPLNTH